jgi:hypothetical protein
MRERIGSLSSSSKSFSNESFLFLNPGAAEEKLEEM